MDRGKREDGQNQERDRGAGNSGELPQGSGTAQKRQHRASEGHHEDEIDLLNQDKRGLRRTGNGGRRQVKNQNENFRFQDFSEVPNRINKESSHLDITVKFREHQ